MQRKWAIIAAIVLGIAAVLLTNLYFRQREARLRKKSTHVLVAAQEISRGSIISYNMLAFKVVPYDYIQPGAMRAKEEAVGKMAAVTIMPEEQILITKLSMPTRETALAAQTPSGKRAVTISMDIASAVGGMVRPQDHVDILATFTNPPITLTLFQDILVLAMGQETAPIPSQGRIRREQTPSPETRPTVTFALSPQEVQILSVAMEHGKIRLTLRPRAETGVAIPEVDLSRVPRALNLQSLIQLYTRPTEAIPTVEVIRGLKSEITPLPTAR